MEVGEGSLYLLRLSAFSYSTCTSYYCALLERMPSPSWAASGGTDHAGERISGLPPSPTYPSLYGAALGYVSIRFYNSLRIARNEPLRHCWGVESSRVCGRSANVVQQKERARIAQLSAIVVALLLLLFFFQTSTPPPFPFPVSRAQIPTFLFETIFIIRPLTWEQCCCCSGVVVAGGGNPPTRKQQDRILSSLFFCCQLNGTQRERENLIDLSSLPPVIHFLLSVTNRFLPALLQPSFIFFFYWPTQKKSLSFIQRRPLGESID